MLRFTYFCASCFVTENHRTECAARMSSFFFFKLRSHGSVGTESEHMEGDKKHSSPGLWTMRLVESVHTFSKNILPGRRQPKWFRHVQAPVDRWKCRAASTFEKPMALIRFEKVKFITRKPERPSTGVKGASCLAINPLQLSIPNTLAQQTYPEKIEWL